MKLGNLRWAILDILQEIEETPELMAIADLPKWRAEEIMVIKYMLMDEYKWDWFAYHDKRNY